MSTTIDERVVEMKFDNKQFESNVSTTMSTLDKLKRALNFDGAGKALDELSAAGNKFSLGGMGAAVDGVSLKFDAMGVAAMTVISRIVNAAIDAGKRIEQELGTGLTGMAAGFNKYGQTNTAVATLVGQGYDMETVTEQMDKLNWYTDETSYNFVEMVSNIGKFTASGQALDTSVQAMMGIANWAALSGQNATTASRAMYQLSQAMGKGVMKYDDWRSIQNASMDTMQFREQAVAAAESLHILEKQADDTYKLIGDGMKGTFTLAELFSSDALSRQQWFTSDVMMKVFGEYSSAVDRIYNYAEARGINASQAIEELSISTTDFGLKAFKAAQEARNWGDVASSVADAVSTAWRKTFEIIFGDYEESKKVFTQMANDLYEIFATPINNVNEMLFSGLASGWKRLSSESGVSLKQMRTQFTKYAEAQGVDLASLIEKYGSFEASLKDGWVTADILTASFQDLEDQLSTLSEEELLAAGYTKEQVKELHKLNEAFRNGTESVQDWLDAFKGMSGRENLIQAIWNIRDALFAFDEETEKATGIVAIFKQAWAEVFPPASGDKIYAITEAIRDFTAKLIPSEETAAKLERTFKGVASVFDIAKQAVSGVVNTLRNAFDVFKGADKGILDFTASIGDMIQEFAQSNKVGDFFEGVSNRVNKVLQKIAPVFDATWKAAKGFLRGAWDLTKRVWPVVVGFLDGVWDGLEQIGKSFSDALAKVTGMSLPEIFDTIASTISEAWEESKKFIDGWAEANNIDLSAGLAKAFELLGKAAGGLGQTVGDIWNRIQAFFSGIKPEGVTSGWQAIADYLDGLWTAISTSEIWTELEKLGPSLETIFTTILSAVGGWVTDLANKLKEMDLEEVKVHLAEILSMLTTGGFSGGLLYALFKGLTKKDVSMNDALVQLVTNIGIAVRKLGGVFSSMSKSIKANVILKLGAAIGMIAASIGYLMNAVKDADPGDALAAFSMVAGLIFLMVRAMEILAETPAIKLSGVGGAFLGMALAVGILTLCMKALVKMVATATPGQLTTAGLLLVGMMLIAALTVRIAATAKAGLGAMAAFIGLAIAIGLLTACFAALVLLATIAPPDALDRAMKVMIGLAAVLMTCMYLLGILGSAGPGIAAGGVAAIGLALALTLLTVCLGALVMLVAMDPEGGKIDKALGVMVGLAAVLMTCMYLLAVISAAGPVIMAGAAAALIMSAAIAVLAVALVALTQLGNMDAMEEATLRLIEIVAVMAAALYLLSSVGPQAMLAAAAMVIFSAAVAILAGAILLASMVPVEVLDEVAGVLMSSILVMVIAGGLAMIVAPGLMALSAALLALGAAALLSGVALLLIGVAMPLLAGGLRLLGSALSDDTVSLISKAAWPLTKLGGALAAFAVGAAPATIELLALAPLLSQTAAALSRLEELASNNLFGELQYSITLFSTGISTALSQVESAVNGGADSIVQAGKRMSSEGPAALREGLPEWEQAGADFVAGVVRGIDSWMSVAVAEVTMLGNRMVAALRESLDEHSPSAEGYDAGMFLVLGVKEGIDQNDQLAIASARDMGTGALDAMRDTLMKISDYLDGNRDFDPVIRPVLDLSNVEEGASRIGSFFSANQAVGIAARMNRMNAGDTADGDNSGVNPGGTFNFVQNNYSPKALNRLEIYRQTRNQISAIEGAMRTV